MFLYINTTNADSVKLSLYNNGEPAVSLVSRHNQNQSEQLLQMIDQLFQKAGWDRAQALQNITGIIVVKGPRGRFSAIRSGVVLANSFGFAWNVPVAGIESGVDIARALDQSKNKKSFQESVIPIYEKEPGIH